MPRAERRERVGPNGVAAAGRLALASVALDVACLLVVVPLVIPYLLFLVFGRRRGVGSLGERFGHVRVLPASRERVWFHAVSVGELEALAPLLESMREDEPELDFVVSTTTTTAQSVARERYGEDRVFLFPLDLGFAVRRTLDRVAPTLVVLVELEIWPQHLLSCARRGVPVRVVNGRVSARGFRRMRWVQPLFGPLLRLVDHFAVQTDEYRDRLISLGVEPAAIEVTGNLKYERPCVPDAADIRRAFEGSFGLPSGGLRWIVGSTHPGEESTLLETHRRLRRDFPGLGLILAPRHVERSDAVAAAVRSAGLSVVRWSAGRGSGEDVVLIDRVGELARLYAAADVAFVGGSLVPVGGHNILEPMLAGTPTLHGPRMHNFRREVELFTRSGGAREVLDGAELEAELRRLLGDPGARRALVHAATGLIDLHRGAVARTRLSLVGGPPAGGLFLKRAPG